MAVPKTDWPLYEDLDRPWDAGEANKRWQEYCTGENGDIDWDQFHKGFFWYDESDPNKVTSHKLPFVDVVEGRPYAIWRAITNARARLNQTQIPEEDKRRVLAEMRKYYRKAGKEDLFEDESARAEFELPAYAILAIGPVAGLELGSGAVRYTDAGDYHLLTIRGVLTHGTYRRIAAVAESITDGRPVVIDIDSPGGEVAGLATAVNAIRALSQRSETVAYTDGVMTSAAYVIGSAARRIVAGETAIIGSIAALAIVASIRGALEKNGVSVHVARSAPLKSYPSIFDALTPEAKAKVDAEIKVVGELVKSMVQTNRSGIDQKLIETGDVVMGIDAKNLGLADEIGPQVVLNVPKKSGPDYRAAARELLLALGFSAEEIQKWEENPEAFVAELKEKDFAARLKNEPAVNDVTALEQKFDVLLGLKL